ncbi:uncharacterized protein LOC124340670 [Daphnia pulicaria]|uniref:uncharacterized protein LOC124340670 n=1 Tax=Daphnia pulicaria TaxID=35523 RepID=UPI001EEB2A55|nr:uncharacterized protein LOC124340670 [Daphnia pulicaria]
MKQSIVLAFLAISVAVAVQPSPMEVFLMGYRYGLAASKQSVFGSIDTQVPQPVSRSSKTNSAASRASFRSIDDDALESSGIPIFTMDGSPSGKRYRQLSGGAGVPLRREETLMFRKTFPENMYPNSDFVSYGTNCDFSAETPLYIVQNVTDPVKCGSHFCYGDRRCTHFAHHYSTNLCRIISSFGSGSSLVSRVTDIQAGFICGLIPNRACNPNSSLQKCITLDV